MQPPSRQASGLQAVAGSSLVVAGFGFGEGWPKGREGKHHRAWDVGDRPKTPLHHRARTIHRLRETESRVITLNIHKTEELQIREADPRESPSQLGLVTSTRTPFTRTPKSSRASPDGRTETSEL